MQMAGSQRLPQRITNKQVGLWVATASFGMLFGTLLLSFLLLRSRAPVWPPLGAEPLDPLLPTLATLVLLLSSVYLHFAPEKLAGGDARGFAVFWKTGTLLGLSFMALQVVFLGQLFLQGVYMGSNLLAASTYTFIALHALHLLGAWGALAWIWRGYARGRYQAATDAENPRLAAWFWHFLDLVWVLTYLLLVWL
jgi:cytochrome c oxidase subunit 3